MEEVDMYAFFRSVYTFFEVSKTFSRGPMEKK